MLQELLNLVRAAGGAPISARAAALHLGLAPDQTEQMMRQLAQRGRIERVEGPCAGCEVCPLHRFCSGASVDVDRQPSHGYRIRLNDLHS